MVFFERKKENLDDQQAVFHERKVPRYALKAIMSIDGFEGEGAISNISVSGCCMESATYVSLIPDEDYQILIQPGNGETMKPFKQKLLVTWTKSSENLFQAGFVLDKGENNTNFERYVESLKSHGVKPDYGNMTRI